MSIANIMRAARLYMRAEMLAVQIRLRAESRRLTLIGLAAILAVLSVALVNLALYRALESLWGPVWTPLVLGAADLVLALIALIAAAMTKPGPELEVAEEMRNLAGAALEDQMKMDVSLPGFLAGSAGGGSTVHLLIPLVTTIIGALRRRKEAKETKP